ncbi:MAG: CbiQ family ECF transporter T component [Gallionella sp.]
MQFHPATQILLWCFLVAIIQELSFTVLLVAAGLAMIGALALSRRKFLQLLRRTRWIMLTLLIIYTFSTPGEPISDALGTLGPSQEGVIDGVHQLLRLIAALAGLAILLDRLHQSKLIAGLYTLFVPLRLLGISRERLAVRLALTLHYSEVAILRGTQSWQVSLQNLLGQQDVSSHEKQIELPLCRFVSRDIWLLVAMLLALYVATI